MEVKNIYIYIFTWDVICLSIYLVSEVGHGFQ